MTGRDAAGKQSAKRHICPLSSSLVVLPQFVVLPQQATVKCVGAIRDSSFAGSYCNAGFEKGAGSSSLGVMLFMRRLRVQAEIGCLVLLATL